MGIFSLIGGWSTLAKGLAFAAVGLIVYAGYAYVSGLQADNARLNQLTATLNAAKAVQDKTIDTLNQNQTSMIAAQREMNDRLDALQRDNDAAFGDMRATIAKFQTLNLKALANAKPAEAARVVNDDLRRAHRLLEAATRFDRGGDPGPAPASDPPAAAESRDPARRDLAHAAAGPAW